MLNLISPGKPELRPPVHKEQQRLAGVTRLHIVQPHPVYSEELVLTIPGVQQTGGGRGPGLDMEQSPPDPAEPDQVTQEEDRKGDQEADQDAHQSQPLHDRGAFVSLIC